MIAPLQTIADFIRECLVLLRDWLAVTFMLSATILIVSYILKDAPLASMASGQIAAYVQMAVTHAAAWGVAATLLMRLSENWPALRPYVEEVHSSS